MSQVSEHWVAWAAGLFEGEGSFYVWKYKRGEKEYAYIRVAITSSDIDVLQKFIEATGYGYLKISKRNYAPHHKQCWQLMVTNEEEVIALFKMMRPYLSRRRKIQFREALAYCQENKKLYNISRRENRYARA